MSKKFLLVTLLVSLVALGGCGMAGRAHMKISPSVKKVAVVSLAVSDWGGSVKGDSISTTSVHGLMRDATVGMLTYTERELKNHWKVERVGEFITNRKYRKAAEDIRVSTYSPVVRGREMPLFGPGFKKGDITQQKARDLCAALHVDAVVLVFSEWTVKTGGFIPMTKAVSKNVVSFWNKKGEKIYFRRIDIAGRKPIGAMGIKAVNKGTIKQWTWGYETALKRMFAAI